MTRQRIPSHRKYRQLLIVLGIAFVSAPFSFGLGNLIPSLLLFYTLIVIVTSFDLPRRWMTAYIVVAALALAIEVFLIYGRIIAFNFPLSLFSQAVFALYFIGAAFWITKDIFTSHEVTLDTVQGGISVYLLIGFVWALLYGIVNTLDDKAFSSPLIGEGSYHTTTYFSFTTLTTLGYGDILPVSELAQMLTNLEAIVGQVYPTVFIAILVGNYLSKRA